MMTKDGKCIYGDGKPCLPDRPLCDTHGAMYDENYAEMLKEAVKVTRCVYRGRKTAEEMVDDVIMCGANQGFNVKIEDARVALGIECGQPVPGPCGFPDSGDCARHTPRTLVPS